MLPLLSLLGTEQLHLKSILSHPNPPTEPPDWFNVVIVGVGRPRSVEHKIKGQGLYAYVALQQGEAHSEALRKSLVAAVRQQIGAFAAPDVIHWVPGAPAAPEPPPNFNALLQVCRRRVSTRVAHEMLACGSSYALHLGTSLMCREAVHVTSVSHGSFRCLPRFK